MNIIKRRAKHRRPVSDADRERIKSEVAARIANAERRPKSDVSVDEIMRMFAD